MATKTDLPFDFDMSKYLTEMKVPGVDMDAMVASQQKNLEALTAANRLAFEGMQAIMKRQSEIMRQAIEDSAAAATGIAGAQTPTDKVIKQTEATKETFEHTIANIRELSELIAKSNTEVLDLLNKRFAEVLDEVKTTVAKSGQQVALAAKK